MYNKIIEKLIGRKIIAGGERIKGETVKSFVSHKHPGVETAFYFH